MNIKTIIFGSLAVGLAIGGTLFNVTSQENESVYTPRELIKNSTYGNDGIAAYMHMLNEDPATGLIDANLVKQARYEVLARSKQNNNKALLGLNWTQMGPDNVGGRTRAVLVDQANPNVVYAGSVAGGLFVSTDGTQHWTPVAGQDGVLGENLTISCITQTDNGRIFFGTGSTFEGATGPFLGNGVYEYVPATGDVLPVLTNSTAVPNNSSSAQLSYMNAIASHGNRLYLGSRNGMVWADATGPNDINNNPTYPTAFSGWFNPIEIIPNVPEANQVHSISVHDDGTMLVTFNGKAYVGSDDQLGSFVKVNLSGSRLSGAIAPSDPNWMYVLRSSGTLVGLSVSIDKGVTWNVVVPGGSPCIDPFAQNDCSGGQGGYDDAIGVDPSDPGHVLVGGVRLYEWQYTSGSNPIGGSWTQAANLFENTQNPFYVHADKHTIVWPTAGTVYIGCDGGVFRSTDGANTWQERNLGYNVTTFYDMNVSANGWFIGGAQDNGCQMFAYGAFGSSSPLGTFEVSGGDGFDVAFSNQGPGVVYTTSQNGVLMRSSGGQPTTFYDQELSGFSGQPFHTVIENWENNWDPLSVDSIKVFIDSTGIQGKTITARDSIYYPGDLIAAGTTLLYESLSNGTLIPYVVPASFTFNAPMDSLTLVDPIQNKFAFRTSQGIYLTRDAARLGAFSTDWHRISSISNIEHMEFSPDGNHLFLATSNGGIIRISNLSMANDSMGLDIRSGSSVITQTIIGSGLGSVMSLAADPNNGNNLIATSSGYTTGNHVYRCTNGLTATGSSGTFTAIQGIGANALPRMPVYDAEIDYNDNDKVIIGTAWGVWTSDNAFSAASPSVVWTDESAAGMAHAPVYAVEQQHLGNAESVNSGFIYLGTYGRGFYMSTDLGNVVSVEENDDLSKDKGFVSNLSVYPNPLSNVGVVAFDLNENSETKVNIYNLTGSLVKTIDLGNKAKGSHKVKFDASSLSIGSYIISLESGSERSVAKFIVTR